MSLAEQKKFDIGRQRHRAANNVINFASQRMMIMSGCFIASTGGKNVQIKTNKTV
jgi:hypothetical protein